MRCRRSSAIRSLFATIALLAAVVVFYSGYNLFIKVSSDHAPESSTSLILATIVLQLAALATSLAFAATLAARGGHTLTINTSTVTWAVFAGISIGAAEIAYFYIFRGVGGAEPLQAGVVVPVIVAGTIVLTTLASVLWFGEPVSPVQIIGVVLVLAGLGLLMRGSV